MQLFLKTLTGKTVTLNHIDLMKTTVQDVKDAVYQHECVPPQQQRLVCNGGMILEDDDYTLGKYNITRESTVRLELRLVGGMSSKKSESTTTKKSGKKDSKKAKYKEGAIVQAWKGAISLFERMDDSDAKQKVDAGHLKESIQCQLELLTVKKTKKETLLKPKTFESDDWLRYMTKNDANAIINWIDKPEKWWELPTPVCKFVKKHCGNIAAEQRFLKPRRGTVFEDVEVAEIKKDAAYDMKKIVVASAEMLPEATVLLNSLAKRTGGNAVMGPVKELKGVFLKFDRKNKGLNKLDNVDMAAVPIDLEYIPRDIKDVLRGTLWFDKYEDLVKAYKEIGLAVTRGIPEFKSTLTGIVKVDNKFSKKLKNPGYRDAKMIVGLNISPDAAKLLNLRQKHKLPNGIPFEIQFNLKRGLIVKSGELKGNKGDKECNYLTDDGMFDAVRFVKDCTKKGDNERKKLLAALKKASYEKGMPKAHVAYKQNDAAALEMYNQIYAIGYRKNGYDVNGNDFGLDRVVAKLKGYIPKDTSTRYETYSNRLKKRLDDLREKDFGKWKELCRQNENALIAAKIQKENEDLILELRLGALGCDKFGKAISWAAQEQAKKELGQALEVYETNRERTNTVLTKGQHQHRYFKAVFEHLEHKDTKDKKDKALKKAGATETKKTTTKPKKKKEKK